MGTRRNILGLRRRHTRRFSRLRRRLFSYPPARLSIFTSHAHGVSGFVDDHHDIDPLKDPYRHQLTRARDATTAVHLLRS